MIAQIRAVSETYRDNGGSVRFEMMEGAGHGPHFDHFEDWSQIFFDFLADNT